MTRTELLALVKGIEHKYWQSPESPELVLADFLRKIAESKPVAWREDVRGTGGNPAIKETDWRAYGITANKAEADRHVDRCNLGIEGRAVPLYTLPLED